MRIDAHHHFWKYTSHEFGWIADDMAAIRRDFSPADLEPELAAAGMEGVVSIEARQSLAETDGLLELASTLPYIKGVVGWLPLATPEIEAVLERYADHEKLVGARHVVQAEADGFLARADFNRGIRALTSANLVYDILIIERQLPQAIEFVDRHPNQIFVLDHIAKPLIRDGVLQPWREQMRELAKRENVFCKISGLVTEADYGSWNEAQLQTYLNGALDAFGPKRLMFGSDWPVCLVASTYARWMEVVEVWSQAFSDEEKNDLWGKSARRVYDLG